MILVLHLASQPNSTVSGAKFKIEGYGTIIYKYLVLNFLVLCEIIFMYDNLLALLYKSVITTMVSRWDTLPAGRFKSHHSSGAICKFTLDIKNSPYSGTLKDGNRTGIIRIGADLDGGSISNTSGPGVSAALKFFRSGIPSGNTVVQRLPFASLTSTYDFFDPEVNIMYNHRNGITRYMIIQDKVNFKNKQGSSIAAATGLSDLAR